MAVLLDEISVQEVLVLFLIYNLKLIDNYDFYFCKQWEALGHAWRDTCIALNRSDKEDGGLLHLKQFDDYTDAEINEFQKTADKWGELFINLNGADHVGNYGHFLIAGHLASKTS